MNKIRELESRLDTLERNQEILIRKSENRSKIDKNEFNVISDGTPNDFIRNKLERQEGASITKQKLYNEYKKWCEKNNRIAVSIAKFSRILKGDPYNLVDWYPIVNGKQAWSWKDVKLVEIP